MKSINLWISFLIFSLIISNASATPMYCAANIQNPGAIITKLREVISDNLRRQCKTPSCAKNADIFAANLPDYPVRIDPHNLNISKISNVSHYHVSLCYEESQKKIPGCDTLFKDLNQPHLLENKLNEQFRSANPQINRVDIYSDGKGAYWLVALFNDLHVSLLTTKDKAFLEEVKGPLEKKLSGTALSLDSIFCRMGQNGVQPKQK